MPANVEIKARVGDPARVSVIIASLTASRRETIDQEDVFYRSPRGRLKLRRLQGSPSELIYYERPDVAGPKTSTYEIYPTADPDRLHNLLSGALGVRGVVRKRREVSIVENTRIHLDQVEGLGTFLELEVMVPTGGSLDQAEGTAGELMATLGIRADDLVEGAYIDLLERAAVDGTAGARC